MTQVFADVEWLFLETLEDLRCRVMPDSSTEYGILVSGALLRKLLLDERPLVHLVNDRPRLKLRFTIHDRSPTVSPTDPPGMSGWALELDPDGFDKPPPTAEVSLEEMLRRPVMATPDGEITVRHVIRDVAHVHGAVHVGNKPVEQASETLLWWEHGLGGITLRLHDLPPALGLLKPIGRVVVKGLEPLADSVRQERPDLLKA